MGRSIIIFMDDKTRSGRYSSMRWGGRVAPTLKSPAATSKAPHWRAPGKGQAWQRSVELGSWGDAAATLGSPDLAVTPSSHSPAMPHGAKFAVGRTESDELRKALSESMAQVAVLRRRLTGALEEKELVVARLVQAEARLEKAAASKGSDNTEVVNAAFYKRQVRCSRVMAPRQVVAEIDKAEKPKAERLALAERQAQELNTQLERTRQELVMARRQAVIIAQEAAAEVKAAVREAEEAKIEARVSRAEAALALRQAAGPSTDVPIVAQSSIAAHELSAAELNALQFNAMEYNARLFEHGTHECHLVFDVCDVSDLRMQQGQQPA